MQRDLNKLTGHTFDVLIVGGGIHGLTIAYDAAQRGLSVALVERDDFGGGASFNHLRTIHGGLRYLQSLDLARARESVRERRALARIAPHAVRPLPFALPLYRSVLNGKLAMRLGIQFDRMLAWDRNSGVPPPLRLPGGRVVSRAEAIERFPGLGRRGLTAAAVWHDYTMPEADRLTFTWAIAAAEHGAILVNYLEALAPLTDKGRVVGVRATDRRTGRELDVAATLTVNATAGSFDRRLPASANIPPTPLLKAMNLVTRRDAGDEALGGRTASGRYLFLVPSRRRAVFGTWESSGLISATDSTRPTEHEVSTFVSELNQAFPSLDLTLDDVTLVHYGAVPARVKTDGRIALDGHERIRDHAQSGLDGLLSVVGAKYTTARAVAERVTDRIVSKLKNRSIACRTAAGSLPGGGLRDLTSAIAEARRLHDPGLPSDTIPHLVGAYGSRYEQIVALAAERVDWRNRVADDSPVIGAELVWAIRHEMALTLSDVVIRRTPLGAVGCPGEPALLRAANLIGSQLGWSDEHGRQEIEDVRHFYSAASRGHDSPRPS